MSDDIMNLRRGNASKWEQRDAADEIDRLRQWKAEATEVIAQWEKVHEALGQPARLGESRAAASLAALERLLSTPPRCRAHHLD